MTRIRGAGLRQAANGDAIGGKAVAKKSWTRAIQPAICNSLAYPPKALAMLNRLVLATVLTLAGIATVSGQTVQPDKHESDKRKVVPVRKDEPARPIEQKWVEDSINKFFDIPGDILNPQPDRR